MTGARQIVAEVADYTISIEPFGAQWRVNVDNSSDARLSYDQLCRARSIAETVARTERDRVLEEIWRMA
jgi:hypothetical protein